MLFMKRLLLIFISILMLATVFITFYFKRAEHRAEAASIQYALVISNDAYLYRDNTLNDSIENRFFLLPITYFTQVLGANVVTGVHKVRYKDIDGYVAASKVEIKDYTPKSIYPPDVTLKINIDSNIVYLRDRPDHLSGAIVYNVPADKTGINYYNITLGSNASGVGNYTNWHFVKIRISDDSYMRGYIYSNYIILETTFPAQNDTTALVQQNSEISPEPLNFQISKDDNLTQILVVACLTVPIIIVIFVWYRRPNTSNSNRNKKRY